MDLFPAPSAQTLEVGSKRRSAIDSGADASTCASTSSSRSTSPSARQPTQPSSQASKGLGNSSFGVAKRSARRNNAHLTASTTHEPAQRNSAHVQRFSELLDASCESQRNIAMAALISQSESTQARDGILVPMPEMVALAYQSQKGSRLVQKAFEVASPLQLISLTEHLRGFIVQLATSKHGNHVIAKMFATTRAASDVTQFAALEILNDPARVVTNQFGCRVVQRILETGCCPSLAEWIAQNALALSQDEYGHFTVETLLECGEAWANVMIIRALMSVEDVFYYGKCCFVVKKVLDLSLLAQLLPQLLQQPSVDVPMLSTWRHAGAHCEYQASKNQASKHRQVKNLRQ